MTLPENIMKSVLKVSMGDMRKTVTTMQSVHQMYKNQPLESINEDDLILEVSGKVPESKMKDLWDALYTTDFNTMQESCENILLEGWPTISVLDRLFDDIVYKHKTIPDHSKGNICERMANMSKCLIDGANESLQLLDVCAVIMRQIKEGKCIQSSENDNDNNDDDMEIN